MAFQAAARATEQHGTAPTRKRVPRRSLQVGDAGVSCHSAIRFPNSPSSMSRPTWLSPTSFSFSIDVDDLPVLLLDLLGDEPLCRERANVA